MLNLCSTTIFTAAVKARTRIVLKDVMRFFLWGRVVEKELTRATQQVFEMSKETRQVDTTTARIFFWLLDLVV